MKNGGNARGNECKQRIIGMENGRGRRRRRKIAREREVASHVDGTERSLNMERSKKRGREKKKKEGVTVQSECSSNALE